MTKDVLVTIKGMHVQPDENQDEIEVVNTGHYKKIGDSHYISYEEVMEGTTKKTHNLIHLHDGAIEVTKKGAVNIHMSFEKDKKNLTYYDTPFGSFLLGIAATNIDINQKEDMIDVGIRYALEFNNEHVADCNLTMNIQSRNQQQIRLM